jgi:membrane-associated phospholipid phosphatase
MQQLVHGPIEVAVGLSFGIGWGILLMYIPHKDDVSIHDNPKVSSFSGSV